MYDFSDPVSDFVEWLEPQVESFTKKVVHHPVARRVKRMADDVATAVARAEEAMVAGNDAVLLEDFPRAVQGDSFTCGVQVSFAVLAWYGKARSPSAVMKALGTTTDGTDADQIARVMRARGLRTQVKAQATMKDLRRAIRGDWPAIVSMDGDHWAVVYGYDSDGVFLADPAVARSFWVRVSRETFGARWDRWAMIVRG